MQIEIQGRTLQLVQGDITDQDTDAIVNAANQYLQLGSGVAGAIRSRGGPGIQQECDQIGGCPVGSAVITGGGSLKARHVIHAVGPLGSDPDADALLISATRRSLEVAEENHLHSICFPAISTGVFGYPIDRCAHHMLSTVRTHLAGPSGLQAVRFCLWSAEAFDTFAAELRRQQDRP